MLFYLAMIEDSSDQSKFEELYMTYNLNSRKIYTYTLCVYIVNCSRITYYFEQCFVSRL